MQLWQELEEAYSSVSPAAEERAARLEAALKAQQFLHDAAEVDSCLADEAAALASGAPGGSNSQQIALRQQALSEAWRSLRGAADLRRKLSVTSSRGRHPSAARCHPQLPQAQQQLRAEKEARDDWFKDVLARGQRLLDEERPSSAEIEERCRAAGGVGAADRLALLPERR
ncbi:unnamed protein product [Danaus chrysippus]|uniref:(African queen) hypothetical protein n=1 Tax=Danaus chrysippus TaxID=151541 RepID=A0A8J2VTZ1_9NEOP|nr:unnamed protein product [Danaus chrysippus]